MSIVTPVFLPKLWLFWCSDLASKPPILLAGVMWSLLGIAQWHTGPTTWICSSVSSPVTLSHDWHLHLHGQSLETQSLGGFNENRGQTLLMSYLQSTAKQQPNTFLLNGMSVGLGKRNTFTKIWHIPLARHLSPTHQCIIKICATHVGKHWDTKSS